MTMKTSPQSWGPATPGTHKEQASPGRMGHLGCGRVLTVTMCIPPNGIRCLWPRILHRAPNVSRLVWATSQKVQCALAKPS